MPDDSPSINGGPPRLNITREGLASFLAVIESALVDFVRVSEAPHLNQFLLQALQAQMEVYLDNHVELSEEDQVVIRGLVLHVVRVVRENIQ